MLDDIKSFETFDNISILRGAKLEENETKEQYLDDFKIAARLSPYTPIPILNLVGVQEEDGTTRRGHSYLYVDKNGKEKSCTELELKENAKVAWVQHNDNVYDHCIVMMDEFHKILPHI